MVFGWGCDGPRLGKMWSLVGDEVVDFCIGIVLIFRMGWSMVGEWMVLGWGVDGPWLGME